MKFLIQTYKKQVKHDFSFTLLESINYQNEWHNRGIKFKLTDNKFYPGYTPIGSNQFVLSYLEKYYGLTPKPVNIPKELLKKEYTNRNIIFGTEKDVTANKFVKSVDKIKFFTEYVMNPNNVPPGNYLISDIIEIGSEWRAFVYKQELIGLQCYSGDFTLFPDVVTIHNMISEYKTAPIAYTLDVGVCKNKTFIIEVHDFFSCGLYGFNDFRYLPFMFYRWFNEYINKYGKNK
jgi:hypothetical protein